MYTGKLSECSTAEGKLFKTSLSKTLNRIKNASNGGGLLKSTVFYEPEKFQLGLDESNEFLI